MNLRNLLKHRNAIYGILSIWIILFHINRRLSETIRVPLISQLLTCGNIAVDIFMFLSGCCLYLSIIKKPDIKSFYKRRVARLFPSYFMITIPYWFWRSLVEAPRANGGFHVIRFFADLSSATFWLSGVQTTWFVNAIFIFYLIFPAIYKVVEKGIRGALFLLFAVYAINIVLIEFIPFYHNSSIAWTRLPVFIFGAIAGKHIDAIDLRNLREKVRIFLVMGVSLTTILMLVIFPIGRSFTQRSVKSEYLWLLYGPLTIMIIMIMMFVMKERNENMLIHSFEILGELSLEMYMTHIIILHWFTYYDLLGMFGLWSFLVIPGLAFLWSMFVSRLIKLVVGKTAIRGK